MNSNQTKPKKEKKPKVNPNQAIIDQIDAENNILHAKWAETGRYCASHPQTMRGTDSMGREGMGVTVAGAACIFRRLTSMSGWQSFCSREDRIRNGCEHDN